MEVLDFNIKNRDPQKGGKPMESADSETLVAAINLVIEERCFPLPNKAQAPASSQCQAVPVMQNELAVLTDLSVQLWDSALHSTLSSITSSAYPHFFVIQRLLFLTLKNDRFQETGILKDVFNGLLTTHPPSLSSMSSYYWRILNDPNGGPSGVPFFWDLLDQAGNLPRQEENIFGENSKPSGSTMDQYKTNTPDTSSEPVLAKRREVSLCLEFLCRILEEDLRGWEEEGLSSGSVYKRPNRQPFISRLLWPSTIEKKTHLHNLGHDNPNVRKIVSLQGCGIKPLETLLNLTAEIVRVYDKINKQSYPFFGTLSLDLSRELSSFYLQRLNDNSGGLDVFRLPMPAWLRLLVLSHILGHMAGFICEPELSSVIAVLEHVENMYKVERHAERVHVDRSPPDPVVVAKLGKLKSVNSTFKSGLTRLHKACHEGDVEMVKGLLAFPSLDLNVKDQTGWTALHVAAWRGKHECVEELLNHVPRIGELQRRVDTRAAGPSNITPIMRASLAGEARICQLLLAHTGSVLLEDVDDENKSAMDWAKNEEVKKILKHYSANKITTVYSKKELYLATGDLVMSTKVALALLQSYLAVHRTWDVYHAIKKIAKEKKLKSGDEKSMPPPIRVHCQYSRYHRDFKTNLPKLRQLSAKLRKEPHLSQVTDILHIMMSMNKA